jgi:hypothetical protein
MEDENRWTLERELASVEELIGLLQEVNPAVKNLSRKEKAEIRHVYAHDEYEYPQSSFIPDYDPL